MKKILGISLVALFAVTPMMAGAANLTEKTPATTDAQKVAAVSYVKGAYNAVASAVNTKQDQLKVGDADVSSAVSSSVRVEGADNLTLVTEKAVRDAITAADNTAAAAISGLDGRLDVLEGDAEQKGSVKNMISVAQSAAEGYADSAAAAAQSAAEAYADGLASNYATATQGEKADTALQSGNDVSLLTNDAGYITKDVEDLTNYTTTANMNAALDSKVNTSAISTALSSASADDEVASAKAAYTYANSAAAAAQTAAEAYANGLASNYDAAGAAASAEAAAKAYADSKFLTLTTTWTDETATSTVQLSNPTQSAGSEVQEG